MSGHLTPRRMLCLLAGSDGVSSEGVRCRKNKRVSDGFKIQKILRVVLSVSQRGASFEDRVTCQFPALGIL